MLTTKNPEFKSIAEAINFLTESRIAELVKTVAELKLAGSLRS